MTNKLFALFLLVTLLSLTGCSSTSTATFPDATNDASTLNWQECDGNFQCATLEVPIDQKQS